MSLHITSSERILRVANIVLSEPSSKTAVDVRRSRSRGIFNSFFAKNPPWINPNTLNSNLAHVEIHRFFSNLLTSDVRNTPIRMPLLSATTGSAAANTLVYEMHCSSKGRRRGDGQSCVARNAKLADGFFQVWYAPLAERNATSDNLFRTNRRAWKRLQHAARRPRRYAATLFSGVFVST